MADPTRPQNRTARRPGHRRRRRRAARGDRGRGAGARVGLVCKSLLGKAHTVMAEGGVAAALGHVAAVATRGRSISATRWSAASSSTTRGWPSSTPRRRRTGSASWSCWGAVFDRTGDGRILQRPFGGHSHPRLAHVGDRTGLEMIRTLQDRAVAAGIDGLHGVHDHPAHHRAGRGDRGVRLLAHDRAAGRLPGQGRGPRHRRHRQGLRGHLELVGVQRRRPGARVRGRRGAHRHGVRPVPPDRHGLAAGRARAARHRGRPRRGRDPRERHRRAVHVEVPARGTPRTSTPRPTRRRRAGSRPCRRARETDARRPPELSTRDNVARAIYTEVKEGRGSPHGGVFLDISYLPAGARPPQAAVDVRAVQGAGRRRHHGRADGGRVRRPITSWAASASTPRPGRRPCPACSPRARWPGACTARTASAAIRCRTCSSSVREPAPARPRWPRTREGEPYLDPVQVQAAARGAGRAARARAKARTRTRSSATCRR